MLRFRREDVPEHEFIIHCYRRLKAAEEAAVTEVVSERLRQKRPVATVRVVLEEGDFSLALKSLERH